ncbi:MAG: Hydrogenase maturation protease [Thermoanaerobacterales bacterium 50_218]|nr:MAG: Hydrogenase maturation protease [Thermoanaerobacterales bacterium 50_218]HAA89871.1 hydrogenase [Peptococcaceae bacterium]
MKPEVLVIGCGNLLAADDAVGLHVARNLKKYQLPPEVKVIEAGTPGLSLLDLWEGINKVIIVDAVRSGAPPGTVFSFDLSDLLAPEMSLSSHGFNIVDAIELGKALGQLPEQLVIVGIEILREEPFQEGLSPEVAAAVPQACSRVLEEISLMLKK